ncbi:MAG: pilus assembly protein PilM [Ruminococcus sp.]|nr:pilus assembly protein PilM [Ruminococcus sp.]MDE6796488.1 pilus assembly protein PilM [Ruminococcus sp.]
MLSFDITDRNIRIVKASESGNKIRITKAASLDVEEELIVNGHIKDIPNVATLINGVIKKNGMPDKEAIVSISSNLNIFKELNVPKVKLTEMQKTVKQQLLAELSLDDIYSVSYTIVGDGESDDTYKVLATACPYEIVNSYREVFKYLGISLKSVMIGCNCITKVLLADTNIQSKMPLLAVQIDNNFVSLNLYEANQLSFSRFASIDPADYDYSEDYVFEAVNENIFRMLQFHRSRNTGETIENIVFYGDTHDYVRLTDELEKLDLKTSLIKVPGMIYGSESLEFSWYANAIGAMFRRDKDMEKINLLEGDFSSVVRSKGGGNEKAGDIVMLIAIAVAAVAVLGIWGILTVKDNGIQDDIQVCQDFIDNPDTANKIKYLTRLEEIKEKVDAYNTMMLNAHDAFYSQPVIDGEKYDLVEQVLSDTAEELGVSGAKVKSPDYSDGTFSFSVEYIANDGAYEELPVEFLNRLLSEGVFENAGYSGYRLTVRAESQEAEPVTYVEFDVTLRVAGEQSAYHPEEETESEEVTAE